MSTVIKEKDGKMRDQVEVVGLQNGILAFVAFIILPFLLFAIYIMLFSNTIFVPIHTGSQNTRAEVVYYRKPNGVLLAKESEPINEDQKGTTTYSPDGGQGNEPASGEQTTYIEYIFLTAKGWFRVLIRFIVSNDDDNGEEEPETMSDAAVQTEEEPPKSTGTEETGDDSQEQQKSTGNEESGNDEKDSDLFLPYDNWEYNIPNTLICPDDGKNLFMVVVIHSLAKDFGQRRAIRETWGRLAKNEGFSYVFVTGIDNSNDVNNRLKHESDTFEDIMQTTILDREENATAKSVVSLKWLSEYCPAVKYVLKVEDHVFLNLPLITDYIKEGWLGGKVEPGKMYGFLSKNYKPIRNPEEKHYVSLKQYPGNVYPNFLGTEGYLFPGGLAKDLYNEALKTKFLPLENVLITGVLAEKLKIPRVDIPFFSATHPDFAKRDHCTLLGYSVVIYKLYREEVRTIWEELKNSKFKCGNFMYYALKMVPKDKAMYSTASKEKLLYPFLVNKIKEE